MTQDMTPDIQQIFADAFAHYQANRLDQANKLCRLILEIDPLHSESWHLLGVMAYQIGRHDLAIQLMAQAIEINPAAVSYHSNMGAALRGLGRLEEAVACYRRVLEIDPDYLDAHLNLGNALRELGRGDDAIACFRRAAELKTDTLEGHRNLGHLLRSQGRLAEAVACYRRVIEIKADDPEGHNNLGIALRGLGHPDEAIASFRTAVQLKPHYPEAHINLGNTFREQGRWNEAVASCLQALCVKPDFADAYNSLGIALQGRGEWEEAIACYRRAIDINPNYPDPYNNIGNVFQEQGRVAEAIAQYSEALRIRPDYAEALNNLGLALGEQGDIAGATATLERAIALRPGHLELYRNLGQYHKFTANDPHLAALEAMAADEDRLNDIDRQDLNFALGKAFDDVGRWEEAFAHLVKGNAIKRRLTAYDEAGTLAMLARLPRVVNTDLLATRRDQGYDDATPVFVVGMPRSGTTMIEQILASHPLVFGANELDLLDHVVMERFGTDAACLDALPNLPAAELVELGRRYATRLRLLAPTARLIVDKMPANFRYAGLIHLILPKARIIHVRRDPIDTCLSCFSKLFMGHQPQTYDLDELGRFYRAYQAVMAHWRAVLPPEAMLEVDYEAVVADLPGQARRLLDHCGLPWDDACLAFHRANRSVRTASAAQVRQPLYNNAVGRWHAYAEATTRLGQYIGDGK